MSVPVIEFAKKTSDIALNPATMRLGKTSNEVSRALGGFVSPPQNTPLSTRFDMFEIVWNRITPRPSGVYLAADIDWPEEQAVNLPVLPVSLEFDSRVKLVYDPLASRTFQIPRNPRLFVFILGVVIVLPANVNILFPVYELFLKMLAETHRFPSPEEVIDPGRSTYPGDVTLAIANVFATQAPVFGASVGTLIIQ